jgi:hypothetical protein
MKKRSTEGGSDSMKKFVLGVFQSFWLFLMNFDASLLNSSEESDNKLK